MNLSDNGEPVLERLLVGPVMTNCYIMYSREKDCAVVVDPGHGGRKIADHLKNKGLGLSAVLLTHGHFDHISGVDELRGAFPDADVPVYAYVKEKEICESPELNLSQEMDAPVTVHGVTYLEDGSENEFFGCKCRLIATPGHTIGSCCYYFEEKGILFSGDTLFEGSVGRTDFPTGSMSVLVRSIKDRLLCLPDNTLCYPGHGDLTSIGREREENFFIQ